MANHVQLDPQRHAHLRVRTERSAAAGDAIMAAPAFPFEFRELQALYPIVFQKENKSGRFRPMVLFGLQDGENLFLNNEGWDASYIPIAARIQPFLIGRGRTASGEEVLGVHIDLESPRVAETAGEPLFTSDGSQTEFLQEKSALLGRVHDADQELLGFSALLNELELLEPFTLNVTLLDGSGGQLAGFYTIAEERLAALTADQLGQLQAGHALLPVFMAVASISQFRNLVDRKNALLGDC